MNATEILFELHDAGITLTAAGDRLRVEAPKGALTDERRRLLAEHKQELLAALAAFARAVHASREREAGRVPVGWTHRAYCRGCGPVYLWAPVSVDGCPWCLNRARGFAIPRPPHAGAYCVHGRTVSGVLVTTDAPTEDRR